MRSLRKKMLEEIDREIARQEQLREMLPYLHVDLWQQAFPDIRLYQSLGDEITLELPMSFPLVAEVKQFIADQFPDWKLSRENQFIWEDSKRAGIFLEYDNPAVKLQKRKNGGYWFPSHPHVQIAFRSEREGTTCVLKRIGTKRKSVPILEVVCADGAQESW